MLARASIAQNKNGFMSPCSTVPMLPAWQYVTARVPIKFLRELCHPLKHQVSRARLLPDFSFSLMLEA